MSPDGKKIAFCKGFFFRDGDHPTTRLGLMNADGTDVKYFGPENAQSAFPSWSPDGRSIVYGQDSRLVIWNLETDTRRNLTLPGGQHDNFPKWSPQGDWIVFSSDTDGDEDFKAYLIKPDGTGLRRLTTSSGDSHPAWSPDGESIVFASARMGFKEERALSDEPQPYGEIFKLLPVAPLMIQGRPRCRVMGQCRHQCGIGPSGERKGDQLGRQIRAANRNYDELLAV